MNAFKKIGTALRSAWENFFRPFRKKVRISARDPHDEAVERWHIFLSPLQITTALLAFVVVLFVAVVTIVAFTPVLDLIPGYPGNRTRNLLIEYNIKLDSLDRELTLWNDYHENLRRIMDGQPPLTTADPQPDSALSPRGDIPRVAEDTELRAQMEGTGPYALQATAPGHVNLYPEMYPPVKGVVISKFDPRAGRFGTNIATTENQPVMAMSEGVVISAAWTPAEGYTLYILHPDNFISAYRHAASLTKTTGDRVYSGEVVGFSSSFTEVQLWMNGTPVDPENYLIF